MARVNALRTMRYRRISTLPLKSRCQHLPSGLSTAPASVGCGGNLPDALHTARRPAGFDDRRPTHAIGTRPCIDGVNAADYPGASEERANEALLTTYYALVSTDHQSVTLPECISDRPSCHGLLRYTKLDMTPAA